MHSIVQVLGAIAFHAWAALTDGLLSLFDSKSNSAYNAEFGKETLLASRFNRGFLISKHRKLTRRKSFENVLLAAPTGAGKSTRLVIKQLFDLKKSTIIVSDPSGELYQLTSGYLSRHFRILTLNFSKAQESAGYNPLSRIQKNSDINRIADMLVSASLGKGSDPYWSLQSSVLIALFIRLVRHMPQEQQHLASVLQVLNYFAADPKTVDRWIVETGDKKLLLDYKSLIATPEKTLQNIVSSAKAALSIFDSEDFARVTAFDSIDFDTLRSTPTVIFLRDGIADRAYTQMLNSLFFEQIFGYLLGHLPGKKELDVFFVLEEASSLHIPLLPVFLANARKHRIGTFVCCQSPEQLDILYGKDARNIYSNCVTKLILPGVTSLNFLKELETLSGKATVTDKNGRDIIRPLITADELRRLGDNRVLIVSGNLPYILGRTAPYWHSWFKYRVRSRIPPAPIHSDIPDTPPIVPQP